MNTANIGGVTNVDPNNLLKLIDKMGYTKTEATLNQNEQNANESTPAPLTDEPQPVMLQSTGRYVNIWA